MTTTAERRASLPVLLLWFGMAAGPAAWGAQIFVLYGVDFVSCTTKPFGLGLVAARVGVSAVFAAVAIAGLVVAYIGFRRVANADEQSDNPAPGRERWMALSGVLLSALFLIGIIYAGGYSFLGPPGCP